MLILTVVFYIKKSSYLKNLIFPQRRLPMANEIYKVDIFAVDRAMLGDSKTITIHRNNGIPLKIPLSRITWSIVPDDMGEIDFCITPVIDDDLQMTYEIAGYKKYMEEFAEAIGLRTGIFKKD